MPDQRDKDFEELQRVNEELTESLERCHFMLAEARAKLSANSNEPPSIAARRKRAESD